MTDLALTRTAPARANWGRWVAECATSWCTNAHMPQLGQAVWLCELCGVETRIAWPADPIAIEAVLLQRPDPVNRNWEPGESLADLLAQNAEHGILPPGLLELDPAGGGVDLLVESGGRVIGGLMYGPVEQRRAVRTGASPAITALPA